MSIRFAVTAFVLFILTACAWRSADLAAFNCPATGCDIVVRVVVREGTCNVEYVDSTQQRLVMPRGVRRVPLRWALEDLGQPGDSVSMYKFEDDAFFLKDVVLYNPFRNPNALQSGKRFQLHNENDNSLEYRYALMVHARLNPGLLACLIPLFRTRTDARVPLREDRLRPNLLES